MANTKRNRKVHAAGILLSLCALGGIAAAAPNVIFSPDAVITASASFNIGDFAVVEDTANKTVTVLSYSGPGGAITLPVHTGLYKPANGYKYIVGEDAFNGNKTITSVTIPSAYVKVESEGFNECTNLTSVTLNEGLEEIAYCGFWNTGLKSVTLPASLKTLGSGAFQSCSNLETVSRKTGTSQLKTVGQYAFASCPKLSSFQALSSSVTTMGAGVFYNDTSLTSLDLEYINVQTVPYRTAYGCTKLQTVWLPSASTKICEEAFGNVGTANSDSNHSVRFYHKSTAAAINTTDGSVKSRVTVVNSSGSNINWGEAFKGMKQIEFQAYPNSAFDYGYHSSSFTYAGRKTISKLADGTASNISCSFKYFDSTTVSLWDTQTSSAGKAYKILKNIPYALPGKINKNIVEVDESDYSGRFQINSVVCKDAAGNTLAFNKPFSQGTTNYYEVKIQPKDTFNINLENMKANNSTKIKISGEPDKSGVATTNPAYVNIVGISLSSASLKPVITLRCYTDFSDYSYTNSNNETVYPYIDSYDGFNNSAKDIYGNSMHGLYFLRAPHPYVNNTTAVDNKPRVTLNLEPDADDVNKGNLFDQRLYWNAGAATVYYAYREKGSSTALNYRSTWTLENLEPEKTYYVYFSSDTSDANRFYTYEFKAPPVLNLTSAALSLEDSLNLNFKARLTDSFKKNGAEAKFSVQTPSGSVNQSAVISEPNSDDSYVFPVKLAAKQLNDNVTMNGYTASGLSNDWVMTKGSGYTFIQEKKFTYTAMKYLNAIINGNYQPIDKALAQTTKDYGIMAQNYFNYNISALSNADQNTALENISGIDATDFNSFRPVASGTKPTGFKSYGVSFVCESESILNVNFNLTNTDYNIGDYTIEYKKPGTNTWKRITPVANGTNKYTYKITGLKAKELDSVHAFRVTKGSTVYNFSLSAMTYFYTQSTSTDTKMLNLGKAIFLYNQAANDKFES